MALDSLNNVGSSFFSCSEDLHNRFLDMTSDEACVGCQSAGLGRAILTAWLQSAWGEFSRNLVVASALDSGRSASAGVQADSNVEPETQVQRTVKEATSCIMKKHGFSAAVWHAPWFVIEVGYLLGLQNLSKLEANLGPTLTPLQITTFRNYLVHPSKKTRMKYAELQAKLGMLGVEPEDLLSQQRKPGLPVFTAWVRELQRIAHDTTQ